MMPNAPRGHRDQEQRQQRNRKNQIPDLFWFLHRRLKAAPWKSILTLMRRTCQSFDFSCPITQWGRNPLDVPPAWRFHPIYLFGS